MILDTSFGQVLDESGCGRSAIMNLPLRKAMNQKIEFGKYKFQEGLELAKCFISIQLKFNLNEVKAFK